MSADNAKSALFRIVSAILIMPMRHVVYIIGAGLSKALQRGGFRVPVMQDFISVSADYMERDSARVIFASIRLMEESGCFQWPLHVPLDDASAGDIHGYARVLRRRPAENIEKLLAAASGSQHTLATKVRYLINRIFVLLGWNVDDTVLRQFLTSQLARPETLHTLITFNYDLFLDRAVQEIRPSWSVAGGYGITVGGYIHDDPQAGPPGPDVLPIGTPVPDANIVILKPHGSLNWLVPLADDFPQGKIGLLFANQPPIIPLEIDGRLRYCTATSTFQYVCPPTGNPWDVLPAIIPPVKTKVSALPLFAGLEDAEQTAIATADEIFVIGWSMPTVDTHQEEVIRESVARRRTPPQELTVVNMGEEPAYFSRIAGVFGVERSALRIFNNGFADFVAATEIASERSRDEL